MWGLFKQVPPYASPTRAARKNDSVDPTLPTYEVKTEITRRLIPFECRSLSANLSATPGWSFDWTPANQRGAVILLPVDAVLCAEYISLSHLTFNNFLLMSHNDDMSVVLKPDANAKQAQKSGNATYTLREARISDINSIATVWYKAFFDDEIIGEMMHPNRHKYPDDVYYFLLKGVRERFWDWSHQFMVVTTINEQGAETVIGAADWRRLGQGGVKRTLVWLDPRNLIAPSIHMFHEIMSRIYPNRAADPSRASWLDEAVAASEVYWTGDRSECWDLHVCGVRPEYQGKGAGKLLAQWGVEEAKKEGPETCASVLCGEKNRGFYGKAGLTVQIGGSENGLALFTR